MGNIFVKFCNKKTFAISAGFIIKIKHVIADKIVRRKNIDIVNRNSNLLKRIKFKYQKKKTQNIIYNV